MHHEVHKQCHHGHISAYREMLVLLVHLDLPAEKNLSQSQEEGDDSTLERWKTSLISMLVRAQITIH